LIQRLPELFSRKIRSVRALHELKQNLKEQLRTIFIDFNNLIYIIHQMMRPSSRQSVTLTTARPSFSLHMSEGGGVWLRFTLVNAKIADGV
jgi:hypothetical protein